MNISRVLCFVMLLALSSLAARAATVTVNYNLLPAESLSGATFDADRALGRARVVVEFTDRSGELEQVHAERIEVPGLFYDAATRTIRLQEGGRETTCAVTQRILWATRFRPTNRCLIRVNQASEAKADAPAPATSEKARFVVEVAAGS